MDLDRHGDGPRPFLGVHGWAGNRRSFRRVTRLTPADATFYTYDLPGYGASPRPDVLTLQAVAESVVEAARQIDDRELTLVGNCGGALFALEAMRLAPDIARRAVLIDPFAYAPIYFSLFTWGAFGRMAYFSTFANPLGRLITNNALRRKRRRGSDLTAAFRAVDHETALDYLRLMCSLKHPKRYMGLEVDIDIVHGERTFAAVRKSLPLWRSVWPELRVHELEGAGHEPIKEAADQLARVVFGEAEGAQP